MDSSQFSGKSILITGGTGSFGRAFAKKLIEEDACRKVIIFSRDEWKQWEMRQSHPLFQSAKMRFFLGDVRDENRLRRAFNEVDIVIHAAALKQVPAAEYNPTEFIKTNVNGGMNVIDAAIDCGVKQVVALSTDKAVNPVNLYGATKLCSDKLFVAANSYVGARKYPIFFVVRYGNVAGSRGSVIPMWRRLLAETQNPIPITDERMTRFWITLPEAVDFVVKCLSQAHGGEIFVPKIPSFKITELAKAMDKSRKTVAVGIREGEKLHELMIGVDDARHTLDFDDHYVIVPEMLTSSDELMQKFLGKRQGTKPKEGFSYTSDGNSEWLDAQALSQRISEVLKDENL
jgi:UDP-N-acetylglucosamine 4,6-dehydratase